jgi:hypothetical protein
MSQLETVVEMVRQGEAEAGLPMEHRICMQLDL